MLLVGSRAKAIQEALSSEAELAILTQTLKTKKSKIDVSFNKPSNPDTKISVSAKLGGK